MRVVPDTNVILSGLFWPGNPARILKLWDEGKINFIFSPETIHELKEKLKLKKFGFKQIPLE